MVSNFTIQSLQDLLTFPFKTSDGRKKLLIAGLFGFGSFIIPILPALFLIGYGGLIMQRMILEKSEPFLPEWNDWDKMLKLGVKLFGAGFIYGLPAFAIMVIGYLGMLVPAILTSSYSANSNSAMDRFLGIQLFGMFGGMACFGCGLFLALALWAVLPVVLSHVAATNSFSAAFHIKDWWKILRVNLGGFIVTLILIGGLYMVMVLAAEVFYMTIVLCIVIPFLFAFIFAYLMIMANVLFAQAYREAVAKLAAQVV
jgi:MFS family permease